MVEALLSLGKGAEAPAVALLNPKRKKGAVAAVQGVAATIDRLLGGDLPLFPMMGLPAYEPL